MCWQSHCFVICLNKQGYSWWFPRYYIVFFIFVIILNKLIPPKNAFTDFVIQCYPGKGRVLKHNNSRNFCLPPWPVKLFNVLAPTSSLYKIVYLYNNYFFFIQIQDLEGLLINFDGFKNIYITHRNRQESKHNIKHVFKSKPN